MNMRLLALLAAALMTASVAGTATAAFTNDHLIRVVYDAVGTNEYASDLGSWATITGLAAGGSAVVGGGADAITLASTGAASLSNLYVGYFLLDSTTLANRVAIAGDANGLTSGSRKFSGYNSAMIGVSTLYIANQVAGTNSALLTDKTAGNTFFVKAGNSVIGAGDYAGWVTAATNPGGVKNLAALATTGYVDQTIYTWTGINLAANNALVGTAAFTVRTMANGSTIINPGPVPALPTVTIGTTSSITATGVTLNGSVNANNASTTVTFEYGLTTSYGSSVTAVQSPVTGNSITPVSATITGLIPNTPYHFRVKGENTVGITYGEDASFVTPQQYFLKVTLQGTGGGSVNSSPTGIHCTSGTCQADFNPGESVTLTALPDNDSVVSWSDACSTCTGGTCVVSVTGGVACGVTFSFVKPARIGVTDYDTLQAAFDAAADGATIMAREYAFPGGLACNLAKTVTIKGGYNQTYTLQSGFSSIKGVTIGKGSVTLERVLVK